MYDILQLNDMLLPKLLHIAEQLKIAGVKKLDKQGLIYKILDSQALTASETKEDGKKKPGRARKPVTVKTGIATEEAEVMQEAPQQTAKPAPPPQPKRGAPGRKPKTEKPAEQAPQAGPSLNGTSAETSEPTQAAEAESAENGLSHNCF